MGHYRRLQSEHGHKSCEGPPGDDRGPDQPEHLDPSVCPHLVAGRGKAGGGAGGDQVEAAERAARAPRGLQAHCQDQNGQA